MVTINFLSLDDLIKELKENNEIVLRSELIKRVEMNVMNIFYVVFTGLVKKNIILRYEKYIGSCLINEPEREKEFLEAFEKLKEEISKQHGIVFKSGIYSE